MAKHVVYLMVDGLKGDLVRQAMKYGGAGTATYNGNSWNPTTLMPNLKELMDSGLAVYSYDAINTNFGTQTFPSVITQQTGIKDVIFQNDDVGDFTDALREELKLTPFFWQQLKADEPSAKFAYIGGPSEDLVIQHLKAAHNGLGVDVFDYEHMDNDDLAKMALYQSEISNGGTTLGQWKGVYFHIGQTDHAGHGQFPNGEFYPNPSPYPGETGMSLGGVDYVKAMIEVDDMIGTIANEINAVIAESSESWADWLYIIVSDHGGVPGFPPHGFQTAEERDIFFLMMGGNNVPSVVEAVRTPRTGTSIELDGNLGFTHVIDYSDCPKIEDMAKTVLAHFNVTPPGYMYGVSRYNYYT